LSYFVKQNQAKVARPDLSRQALLNATSFMQLASIAFACLSLLALL
jgi:hypothetical protein